MVVGRVKHPLLYNSKPNLVPSNIPTHLRRGGEDSGEIEILTNFYWLLENNDSWYVIFQQRRGNPRESKPFVNQYALSMLLQMYCK